ncbi:MAG TPA: hypothetical protein VHP36_07635 [Chitinispirillaceae bacterium]|nr:hypothetical protein [Chitinispirillaceae bacterium]
MILELFMELKDDPEAKEYIRMFSFYVEHAAMKELKEMLNQKVRHYFTEEELESSSLIKWMEERGFKKASKKVEKKVSRERCFISRTYFNYQQIR